MAAVTVADGFRRAKVRGYGHALDYDYEDGYHSEAEAADSDADGSLRCESAVASLSVVQEPPPASD